MWLWYWYWWGCSNGGDGGIVVVVIVVMADVRVANVMVVRMLYIGAVHELCQRQMLTLADKGGKGSKKNADIG